MKNEEKAQLAATAAAAVTIVGFGVIGYLSTLKKEKAKRAKIELRKQEGLACIDNYRNRMMDVITDPEIPLRDVTRIMREENAFLTIALNDIREEMK